MDEQTKGNGAPNAPNQQPVKVRPNPLPAKIEDWTRFLKVERDLNNLVEDAHRVLVEKVDYRECLEAVWDSDAKHGSLAADNFMAALQIQNWAKSQEGSILATKNLATIVKALNTVMRRYHASRRERRNMVGGEEVEGDSGD